MSRESDKEDYRAMFEAAPISLWEEDFSGIKRAFDALRTNGVTSLEEYLESHPEFVDECMRQIVLVRVNQHTLTLFKAESQADLIDHLGLIFRDEMREHFRLELLALWRGEWTWSGEGVNYALDGQALDIRMSYRILPEAMESWQRVLITLEDITARKDAERRFEKLFEASPISLWEEDWSGIKEYLDSLREEGVSNLAVYLEEHPEAVSDCIDKIKVMNVNRKTLELFKAQSKSELFENLNLVFRDEMSKHFAQELTDLWNGVLNYEREGINYSLSGEPIQVQLNVRIMPGYEDTFKWVLVSLQDITARKKAEEYLRYLGTHDVMTGLYNRAFMEEKLREFERERIAPIGFIVVDLNGLKPINDTLGHQTGDDLIRRAGEVLRESGDKDCLAARIGGDEFILIMPGANDKQTAKMMTHIQQLVNLNNKFHHLAPPLSLSMGMAVSKPGIPLEKVISQADDEMYKAKGRYYRRRKEDVKD